jgi:hypothetical protein
MKNRKAAYYREQATKSRALASRAKDPTIKGHLLLQVAEQYGKLAAEVG